MKFQPYQKEIIYGLALVLTALVSSVISHQWFLSFLVVALIYILWKWVEFYHFYHWYKNGAKPNKVPLNHGFWQEFAQMVIKNKSKNNKIEKRNKLLLNQFNKTAQALPYATIILNKKREITWVNSISYEILGIKSENKGERITDIVSDNSLSQLFADENKTTDIEMNHPFDELGKIHLRLVKLSNKRYLLVARDISQQTALRQSRKAFVDNASHELRTPLTVITGYLEMLYNADDIPENWQPAIEQAKLQSKRMEKIINDMLKLSSIEHNRHREDNAQTIDMPVLINRLLNDVKNATHSQAHHFTANIDSSIKLKGNEDELTSVVLNLLNNAVIHTKAGTQISIKWFLENDIAQLCICDNGEGIDAKHLPHLSERFYRVDNSRDKNTDSTGLGLAIVKQICDNMNAKLIIESQPKNGTCFQVLFERYQ